MNAIDIGVLLAFLIVFGLGYFGGLVRVAAGLVAFAVGLVGAAMYGQVVADLFDRRIPSMSSLQAELFAVVSLVALIGGGALYVMLWSFRLLPLRSRRVVDFSGGLVGLFLTAVLATVLSAGAVNVMVRVADRAVEQLAAGGTATTIARQLDDSVLVSAAERLSPYVGAVTASWLPVDPPSVLAASNP